jgi:hypothetical protein
VDVGGGTKTEIGEIYDEYDVKIIKLCRLRWVGHVMMMEESCPAKKVLHTIPGGNGEKWR